MVSASEEGTRGGLGVHYFGFGETNRIVMCRWIEESVGAFGVELSVVEVRTVGPLSSVPTLGPRVPFRRHGAR